MSQIALHYLWWIAALLLLGGEVLLPGYFMLWIGLAAAVMGVVLLAVPGLTALAQAVIFVVLAFASCFLYWKWVRPRLNRVPAGNERLNRRGEQLIGQRYTLCEPIVQGRGKARVGDGMWLVTGPDLPLGATVEVIGIDGTTLRVKAVDVA
ncbi:MAG: NfeD family protein [Luteibacter sp.]|jgi:membrane protein implicated in regulation of membrane protease activity|uniref:NfeD family protein n=1 Tax=Luteibacter sp. TaxID=1886636 RepID=UPI002807791F|nr:NfeD family protein [Luteibacter sp.]MDQ7997083.1 NfeD family protein [Luteibacter sp.]MDQ8050311.1 NfeD family protein [Luteibacter sp.]